MSLSLLEKINRFGNEKVIVMDKLREAYPEMFNEWGAMDYQKFDEDIRPNYPIQIRHDKNSIAFTLQNGPTRVVGHNGCDILHVILFAMTYIEHLNETHPCEQNKKCIGFLSGAIGALNQRTEDREKRQVEGTNNL